MAPNAITLYPVGQAGPGHSAPFARCPQRQPNVPSQIRRAHVLAYAPVAQMTLRLLRGPVHDVADESVELSQTAYGETGAEVGTALSRIWPKSTAACARSLMSAPPSPSRLGSEWPHRLRGGAL